jgi:hypothetical protein
MSTNDNEPSSRYIDGPPEKERQVGTIPRGPLLQPIVPPADYRSPPIERLLDWLINRWTRPTICARDIYVYGPRCTRNLKSALGLTKILTENGWLAPVKSHRYDRHKWQIIRGPSQ